MTQVIRKRVIKINLAASEVATEEVEIEGVTENESEKIATRNVKKA